MGEINIECDHTNLDDHYIHKKNSFSLLYKTNMAAI